MSDHRLSSREVNYQGLRERATRFGLETLADEEALALVLSRALPDGARTWAQVLIGQWGTFARVVAADVEELAGLIGRSPALELKLLHDAALRIAAGSIRHRDVISSWSSLQTYLRVRLGEHPREQFRVLYLDKRNQLIRDEVMGDGTTDHAPVYPREVVRRALQLAASSIILVHNHPSGDAQPSRADVTVTKAVIDACGTLKIQVHDHVLVAGQSVVSLRALGLI